MRRSVLLLIVGLSLATTPALAAGPSLKTGHYTGTTSQHFKLTLRVFYTKLCGGRQVRRPCLEQVGRIKIAAKCSSATTEVISSPDTFQAIVGRSGKLSGAAGVENIKWSLTISPKGTIKGSLYYTGTQLTNANFTCRSGKVTFALRRS